MRLSKAIIKNYRNFLDEEINFNSNSIIIGPNDVGKTNLLMAIRILLDKSLSYLDLEPQDKDFNIFSEQDEVSIILEFSDIKDDTESYIYANLGQYIENEKMYIMYKGYKKGEDKFKFFISARIEEETFQEISGRNRYINMINCVYLDSTRQLKQFLKKSKNNMIESYKSKREPGEIESDSILISKIDEEVNVLNNDIENISYINKSATFIRDELKAMSSHNDNLDIKLSSYNDTDDITEKVELVAQIGDKKIEIGGDGRSNQIYMSMWIKEMSEKYDESKQFVIFLLEEPESHLHFPLQSMTVRQLLGKLKNQFIITSHSTQVVLEFNPHSIIRLYFDNYKRTKVANNGCSSELRDDIVDFGYRYNLITGSMFFSSGVFLVEGVSELLLYKYLAKKLNLDLEKHNIQIIEVDGIGFKPYVKLLKRLNIPFSLRTDNDVVQNSQNLKYYYSGINRLISYYNQELNDTEKLSSSFECLDQLELNKDAQKEFTDTLDVLKESGYFLSNVDLENDLANCSFMENHISENYSNKEEFVSILQKSKAKNMYSLIEKIKELEVREDAIGDLFMPIQYLLRKVNE